MPKKPTYEELELKIRELEKADIKRKEAENALMKSKERYRQLFDHAPDAIFIENMDDQIIDVNRKACQLLGYTRDELLSMTVGDLQAPEIRGQKGNVIKNELQNHNGMFFETVNIHKDGTRIPAEISTLPLDEEGHVLCNIRDITERKKTERKLKESQKKYRSLSKMLRLMCDNVTDMIWAKDLEKKYIFANKSICRTLLNTDDSEEPIGKTDQFFSERERTRHPNDPHWHTFGELCLDSDTLTLESKIPKQFDECGNVKGEYLFLDVHKAPFFDDAGKLIGIVGSARDVTEDRKKQAEREKLISALQDALAEVKTLSGLLPICMYCKSIRDDKGYWNKIEAYIREHSDVKFSHGICSMCAKKYFPDISIE